MKKEDSRPVIDFSGYRINDLKYKNISEEKFKNDNPEVNVRTALNMERLLGSVRMKASFYNSENGYRYYSIEIDAFFEIREDISEEEAKKYVAVNGSAMLYPYLRSITSVITSLDNEDAITLPSLNFEDMYKTSKHENDK
ncbi:hypothetical protein DS831_06135 [Bombilactobacillus bombi]|uniref:Preprotein translocase subunit SecB n=1 Tax=Bombilactobacillus bombi TaxID=1303590 RepID=A0A417ZEN8_9LACO|nr:protein-export chaperone SecB [Bombilactobacillus bombi]RHW49739.1 hypothetical protein DS831_06135 [Bombilactobacillus bombi]